MRIGTGLASGLLVAGVGWVVAPGVALGEEPVVVDGPVTDVAGVLGDETGAVEEALEGYFDRTGLRLFVVYVESFDGTDGAEWARRSAQRSGLGTAEVLLAVATDDRSFGYDVAARSFSPDDLERVESSFILPELSQEDWAGTAVAAADGFSAAAEETDPPWGAILLAGTAAVAIGGWAVGRLRHRFDRDHEVVDEHGRRVDPATILSTEELDERSRRRLVEIDDALLTSAHQLGHAERDSTTLGHAERDSATAAIASLRTIVAEGRAAADEAFTLRRRLDDVDPSATDEQRVLASQILARCDDVDHRLDDGAEEIDRLRQLSRRAPELLTALTARHAELRERLPGAQAALDQLRAAPVDGATAAVRTNLDQARQLLAATETHLDQGRSDLATDERGRAIAHLRTAEDALGQTTMLLDAVEDATIELTEAPGRVVRARAALQADVADGERLSSTDPELAAALERGREALRAAEGDHDPLAVAAALEAAEAGLGDRLAPVRAGAGETVTQPIPLRDAVRRTTRRIAAVGTFVETRRGAIGSPARARLAEARQLVARARDIGPYGNEGAEATLRALARAEELAATAQDRAEADVASWLRRDDVRNGPDPLVLAGILVEPHRRGGTPASFGGSRTRGRRLASRRP